MKEAPHCGTDHWKLILSGSRFCKDAESRYRPVEGESLPVAYALESTRMYMLGNPHMVMGTDHKALVSIMGPKNLEEIKNPQVRSQKDKTLTFKFDMKHVPGPKKRGPDATSRYPGTRCTEENKLGEMEGTYSTTSVRRWQITELGGGQVKGGH